MMIDARLYVNEVGPDSAPTIVFLHGGGTSGWMWDAQVATLSPAYHCLIPDLPEQGKSHAIGPFTMPYAAEQVADLIRTRAHAGKAHVVGLSLGAQTLVELLSLYPELVERALVSSALLRPMAGIGLFPMVVKMYRPFQNMDWLVRANMKGLGVPESHHEQFREDTRLMATDALIHVLKANAGYRLPAHLDKVVTPTLVVIGQKEYKVMYDSARELVAALPYAEGYIVQGHNHNWSFEAPELFTELVQAWISDQPLPPALIPLN